MFQVRTFATVRCHKTTSFFFLAKTTSFLTDQYLRPFRSYYPPSWMYRPAKDSNTGWPLNKQHLFSSVSTTQNLTPLLIIGVYAARPTVPAGEGREHEELVVKYERFEVKLFDD